MKKLVILIMLVFMLLVFPHSVLADSTQTPPPGWLGSYVVTSPDEKYILVMLGGAYKPTTEEISPETDAANKLALKYPVSGLYRNDGSIRPLWEMKYMSWQTDITLSSDGHHVVVWGEWPITDPTYSNTALTFYEDGRWLNTYTVHDLVVQPNVLPHSVSHYHWLLDSSLDDERALLNVETYNHEKYLFNLHTGKIFSAIIPTVTPASHSQESDDVSVASVSTVLPDTALSPARSEKNYTFSIGLLVSAGSLTTVFAGASVLGARARRKRANNYRLITSERTLLPTSEVHTSHTRVRVVPPGSAGTVRHRQRVRNKERISD